MNMPGFTSSAETLIKVYGTYHLTRLQADKNVKELAEASAMTAMAVRDGEDAAFDDAVGQLALDILKITGNSKKAPLYLKYFPDGMSAIVGAPLEAELQKASVILAKLAEEEETAIAAHSGPIRAALEALATAIDTHKGAMEVEMQTYGMLQTEKVNWLDQYKKNYRDLTRLFYKTPKKADTYFKPASKGKKGEEAPAPAVPKV